MDTLVAAVQWLHALRLRDEELLQAPCHLAALKPETIGGKEIVRLAAAKLGELERVFTGGCKCAFELGDAQGLLEDTYLAFAAAVARLASRVPEGSGSPKRDRLK